MCMFVPHAQICKLKVLTYLRLLKKKKTIRFCHFHRSMSSRIFVFGINSVFSSNASLLLTNFFHISNDVDRNSTWKTYSNRMSFYWMFKFLPYYPEIKLDSKSLTSFVMFSVKRKWLKTELMSQFDWIESILNLFVWHFHSNPYVVDFIEIPIEIAFH